MDAGGRRADHVRQGERHDAQQGQEAAAGEQDQCQTGGGEAGVYYASLNHSDTVFSKRDMVSGYAAKHSQITSLPGGNLITVWDESVPVNGAYSSCIGLEEKNAGNKNMLRRYITEKDSGASFPVICTVDKNKVLVAFTKSDRDKKTVVFKTVQFYN